MGWGKEEREVFLGKEITRLKNYSEEVAYEIDKEVKKIITECYEKAKSILTRYREELDYIANLLLEKETIEGDELNRILKKELKIGEENKRDKEEKEENEENVVEKVQSKIEGLTDSELDGNVSDKLDIGDNSVES